MNLAIFGGSFNPPHSGHRAIIECALKCEFIDFLIVLPNFKNPLKRESEAFLSDKERFNALELVVREAVDSSHIKAKIYKKTPTKKSVESLLDSMKDSQDSPCDSLKNAPTTRKIILISNYEIAQKKPSFAIKSILHFKNFYAPKNLYFIIGADILGELEKWHKIDEIRQNARFIVATRGEIPVPSEFLRFEVSENISSTHIRANVKNGTNLANLNLPNLKNGAKILDILNEIDDRVARNRLESIINLLDSKKAENIALFDLRETPYITRFVVIATSLADKHSFALLDTLKTELKANGETFYSTDEESGDWIIADLGDIMIHIFTENHRKKFNLEEFLAHFKKDLKREK